MGREYGEGVMLMARENELEFIFKQMVIELDKAVEQAYSISREDIQKAYDTGVEIGNKDLSEVGVSFNIPPDPSALEFLEGYSLDLIKGIGEDLKKEVKRVVREGLIQGKGTRSIAKDLKNVLKRKEWRLHTIARTETLRASNYGRYDTWKRSRVVVGKEWVTAFDDRTCPECELCNGDQAPINKPFNCGVLMPPLHPNCRCTAIPILDRELAGLKKGQYDNPKKYLKPRRRELKVRAIEREYTKNLIKSFRQAFKGILEIWDHYGRLLS